MNDRSAKEEGLRDDEKRSVFYTLLESPALPPAEKTMLRLEQEGTLLVLAGKFYFSDWGIPLNNSFQDPSRPQER